MKRSGLKKVKKSTRSGTRSYWVRSEPLHSPSHPVMKSYEDQGRSLGHGMGNLGSGLGLVLGSRFGAAHGSRLAHRHGLPRDEATFGAALVGGHFGSQAGRQVGRVTGHVMARAGNLSQGTERTLGSFASLAGTGLKVYGLYQHAVAGMQLYGKHREGFHSAYRAYQNYTR